MNWIAILLLTASAFMAGAVSMWVIAQRLFLISTADQVIAAVLQEYQKHTFVVCSPVLVDNGDAELMSAERIAANLIQIIERGW